MTAFWFVMAEAVFFWTTEAQVQSQASLHWFFVVDGVALGQILFWVFQFFCQCHLIDSPYTFIHLSPTFHDLCIPDHVSFIWMTYTLLYLYVHHPQCPAIGYLPLLPSKTCLQVLFWLTVIVHTLTAVCCALVISPCLLLCFKESLLQLSVTWIIQNKLLKACSLNHFESRKLKLVIWSSWDWLW